VNRPALHPRRSALTSTRVDEVSRVSLPGGAVRAIAVLSRGGDVPCVAIRRFYDRTAGGVLYVHGVHVAAALELVDVCRDGRGVAVRELGPEGDWRVRASTDRRAVTLALVAPSCDAVAIHVLHDDELDAFARACRLALRSDPRARRAVRRSCSTT
jgi:hypothetical protein